MIALHPVTLANASTTLPQVLSLIKELCVFEKEPVETVKATPELLHRNLFGGQDGTPGGQYAQCVLAYDGKGPDEGGIAVGMALYLFVPFM